MSDIVKQLSEQETDQLRELATGRLLKPGERGVLLILLDLACKAEKTNQLLTSIDTSLKLMNNSYPEKKEEPKRVPERAPLKA